jgi:hypothetical protein
MVGYSVNEVIQYFSAVHFPVADQANRKMQDRKIFPANLAQNFDERLNASPKFLQSRADDSRLARRKRNPS